MDNITAAFLICWICFLHSVSVNGGGKLDIISDGEAPHIIEQPLDVTVARHQPATLNCRAGGSPPPTIRWYKGGTPVAVDAHRVLLPAGALFFLRAVHGKTHSDAGIYWCEATNVYGTARSRNASLHVAVLRDEFRLEPASMHTAQGETVLLECSPPRGSPEPSVYWKKNGQTIHFDTDSRMHLVDGGSLVIQDARQSDAGRYQCVARNSAGSRESAVATLKIHIKPYLITGPEDVIAQTGGSVTFQCRVGGDPLPDVMWRRTAGGGTMPFNRVTTLDDRSLRIDDITIADEGEYFCEADNSVGSVSASGILTVYDPPIVNMKSNINAQIGEFATFECISRGKPEPTMFWSLEGNRTVIFPGASRGKFKTTSVVNGVTSLTIENINKSDTGIFIVCSAVNFAGSAFVRGKLRVSSEDDQPPPIITNGPCNQTLPIKSFAIFPCSTTSLLKPDITWYHDGTPLFDYNANKINITSNTLVVKDLEKDDSGTYTCVASTKNGKYIWSGQLIVDFPTNPNLHFFRAPDTSTLPGPPIRLKVMNQTEKSVVLTWNQNNKIGSSSLLGYRIEMFSRELAEYHSVRSTHSWAIMAERVKDTTFTVNDVVPGATYLFFVRAENSHGISEPSLITEPITIQDGKLQWSVGASNNYSVDVRSNPLNNHIVELIEATPIDSVTIKVMWEVVNFYYLEGIFIYYRSLDETENKSNDFEIKTILHSNDVSGFEVTNLRKFTRYEFFLVPFYKNFEGKPSNLRVTQTLDDVPDGPPTEIEMYIVNSTTVHLQWSPPEPHLQNGIITSYNVLVHWLDIPANKSMVAINTTIDSATSLIMTNLTSGVSYSVQVSAATAVGYGPYSPITYINIESNTIGSDPLNRFNNEVSIVAGDFVMEMWIFIIVGALATLSMILILAFIYVRRNNIFSKKDVIPNIYDSNGTSLVTQMNIKTAVSLSHPLSSCYNKNSITKTESLLWMDSQPGRKKHEPEKISDYDRVAQPLPEYAEVTSSRVIENEWDSNKNSEPAAYASVTLVANTRKCSWFPQNKQSSFKTHYPEDEELYPAINGGYYNRNVYSEKLRKPINFYDFNHKASSMYNQSVNGRVGNRIYEDDNNFESDEENYADDEKGSEYGNVQAMRLLNHHYARPTFNDEHEDSRRHNRTLSRLTSFKRSEQGVQQEHKNVTAPR